MIALDIDSGFNLVNTGLFDIMVADFTEPGLEANKIVEYANIWLPFMPIIAISNSHLLENIDRTKYIAVIERPLQGKVINAAVDKAVKFVEEKWANRRLGERIAASVPVLLNINDLPVTAQCRNISPDGVSVELAKDSNVRENQLLPAILQFPDESLKLEGKVKFISNEKQIKVVGISFEDVQEMYQQKISNYIRKAA